MTDCLICQRIPPKNVFQITYKVLNGYVDKKIMHNIAVEMIKDINYADKKHRAFFCGHHQIGILSGLLYLVVFNYNLKITQRGMWYLLEGDASEVVIRINYLRWLHAFPELFKTFDKGVEGVLSLRGVGFLIDGRGCKKETYEEVKAAIIKGTGSVLLKKEQEVQPT
jgi:hypothetical protein